MKELLSSNPFVSSLDYSNRGLTQLDQQTLSLLSHFPELRRLDLSDNHLRRLPPDLSALSLIDDFDLNGNPLDEVEVAVDALTTMGNLRSLRINLHEEEQVDYLLRALEGLQELNGLAVEREALFCNNEEEGEGLME